ncbi:MAG: hypothetical protein ACRD8O_05960, partial [Bryobacteraceae bacterium]
MSSLPAMEQSATTATKPLNGSSSVTPAEVSTQLDRILQSPAFQRSERLQRFLRFVCESTLKGEGHLLHEYLIGSEVFGRGPEYSPHEDGIVRRQAHALRRKLQEYYEKDGADDPVRIDLPVGRYVPLFRRSPEFSHGPSVTSPEVTPEPAVEQPSSSPHPAQATPRRWMAVVFSAGVTMFLLGWLAASRTRTATVASGVSVPPEIREIWGPWLAESEGATLCFSNPLTAVIKHVPELLAPNSQPPRQLLSPEQDKLFRSVVPLPPGGHLYFAPAISQAKMGEAVAAVHLTSMFASAGKRIRATQSRFISWEDLTRENIILLGHSEANPWLDRILKNHPFQLTTTTRDKQRAIVNSQPEPGQPSEYQIRYGDESVIATEE